MRVPAAVILGPVYMGLFVDGMACGMFVTARLLKVDCFIVLAVGERCTDYGRVASSRGTYMYVHGAKVGLSGTDRPAPTMTDYGATG